jgi:hypothetical protein
VTDLEGVPDGQSVCGGLTANNIRNKVADNFLTDAGTASWQMSKIRGGADKSLARPTSRCHRTESIVSWERGVHVLNCKSFLVTEAERKHVRQRA